CHSNRPGRGSHLSWGAGCKESGDGGANRGRSDAVRADQSCLRAVCGRKIHAAAQTAGRSGKLKSGAFLLTSISEDEPAAREAIKPLLAAMIALMAGQPPTPLFTAAGMDPEELRRFAETYARGELPVRLVTDSIIDTFAIAGGPDRCGAALPKILDAGVTHAVFFETPGTPAEKTIRPVHKYFMPRFL